MARIRSEGTEDRLAPSPARRTLLVAGLLLAASCSGGDRPRHATPGCLERLGTNGEWQGPEPVAIQGYGGSAMEPRASADGLVLFWNDKPAAGDDLMDLHYAVLEPGGYRHVGTVPGTVDGTHLDGVPAIDAAGRFYFVSTRAYATTFRTIFGGQVQVTGPGTLQVAAVQPADAVGSAAQAGILDMDVDVSWAGTTLVASRARFSGAALPDASALVLLGLDPATRTVTGPLPGGDAMLAGVNLDGCLVYAASLSSDELELYYTVAEVAGAGQVTTRVVVSKRGSTSAPFGPGAIVEAISGELVEGPAISVDGRTLLFHRLDPSSGLFGIHRVTRP